MADEVAKPAFKPLGRTTTSAPVENTPDGQSAQGASTQGQSTQGQPAQEQSAGVTSVPEEQQPAKVEVPVVAKLNLDDINDDELIALANKRFGTSFASADDLKPKAKPSKEELEAAEEKLKTESFEWAIGTGRIKLDEYNKYVAEKDKNPREIALAVFGNELRQEGPKITDAEVEEIFKDTYHEDADTDTRLYTQGQKQIQKLANIYLKEISSKVEGYEDDFKGFQSVQSRFKDFGGQVKERFETLSKENEISVSYKGAEDKEETIKIPFSFDDADLAAVRKQFQAEEMFYAYGADKGAVDAKKLDAGIRHHLSARVFDKVLKQVAIKSAETAGLNMLAYLSGKKIPQVAATIPGTGQNTLPAPKDPPKYKLLAEWDARNGGPK